MKIFDQEPNLSRITFLKEDGQRFIFGGTEPPPVEDEEDPPNGIG